MSTALNPWLFADRAFESAIQAFAHEQLEGTDALHLQHALECLNAASDAEEWARTLRSVAKLLRATRADIEGALEDRASMAAERRAAGQSVADIARELGLTPPRVVQLLRGDRRTRRFDGSLDASRRAVDAARQLEQAARGVRWVLLMGATSVGQQRQTMARALGLSRSGLYKVLELDWIHAFRDRNRWAGDVQTDGLTSEFLDLELSDAAAAGLYSSVLWQRSDHQRALGLARQGDEGGDGLSAVVVAAALSSAFSSPEKSTEEIVGALERAIHRGAAVAAALGHQLSVTGRNDAAMDVFRAGAAAGDPACQHRLGLELYQQGKEREGLAALEAALEAGFAMSGASLGHRLAALGREAAADRAYEMGGSLGDPIVTIFWARWLNIRGDRDRAHSVLLSVMESNCPLEHLDDLAEAFFRVGDRNRAEEVWRRAIGGGTSRAAVLLGDSFAQQGRTKEAELAYRSGEELGDAAAALQRGRLHLKYGRRVEAWGAFLLAAEAGVVEGMVAIGHLAAENAAPDVAEEWLVRADRLGSGAAANKLGALYERTARPEEAAAAWQRGISRGDDASAYNAGLLAERRGDDPIEFWRLAAQGGHGWGAYRLGMRLEDDGDELGAFDAYRVAADAGNEHAAFNFAIHLERRGDVGAFEHAVERAVELRSAHAAVLLAVLKWRQGDKAAARVHVQFAIRSDDGAAFWWTLSQRDAAGHHEFVDDALAAASDAGDALAAVRLGWRHEERGELEHAITHYGRADALRLGDGAQRLGVLLWQTGDVEGARAAFARAEARGEADSKYGLGVIAMEAGNEEEALTYWRAAFAAGNEHAAAQLAFHAVSRSDWVAAEAPAELAAACEIDGAILMLGRVLLELERSDEAEPHLSRGLELGLPGAQLLLGVCFLEQGRVDEAAEMLSRDGFARTAAGAYAIAHVLMHERDFSAVEAALRTADELGHPEAPNTLAVLCELARDGRTAALRSFERAASRGSSFGEANARRLHEDPNHTDLFWVRLGMPL